MLKIKNTLSFAALVCGLLICFNAPAAAQDFVPPGSYQLSCVDIKTVGADLVASCGAGGGGVKTPDTLTDYFECDGDIANHKAFLECNRNINSPRMVKWRGIIDTAHQVVAGSKTDGYEQQKSFLRQMFAGGMAPLFYEGGTYQEMYSKVEPFVKSWLSKPENISRKAEVVERAFKDVYNYGANPKDLAFYNSQKIGYKDVVVAETAKLNSKPFVRRVMIVAAYKKTMGRAPTVGDFAYWEPRTEIFTQIVDAARAYLYSASGANDLTEAVKRALGNNMSGEPTSAQIKSAIVKYTPKKTIFDEM